METKEYTCDDAGLVFCAMDWDSLPEGWSCRAFLWGPNESWLEFIAPNGQVFSAYLHEKEK